MMSTNKGHTPARDFIRQIVKADVESGRYDGRVVTRFPPEPNGYLHVGHVKAISLNFGIAEEFGGRYHLRFDDTNPAKEEEEYIDSIQQDLRWLGFDWGEHLYHASDHFEPLYAWAEPLIEAAMAFGTGHHGTSLRRVSAVLHRRGTRSAVPRMPGLHPERHF